MHSGHSSGTSMVSVSRGVDLPPNISGQSQFPAALSTGILIGVMVGFVISATLVLGIMAVVFKRRRSRRPPNEKQYNRSDSLPEIDTRENSAYGQLEMSIPDPLGVFSTPVVEANAAYGVLEPHRGTEDTQQCQTYEEPQFPSLVMM